MPSLPTPQGAESLEELARCASVQLFVDRAQAIRPDFQVTKANAAAVAELCQRLEGLPLALELAAARSPSLAPAQLLTQLTRRFEVLVGRQRDAVPRHRSLRAALEWSYHLLAPELQRFFARLSIFRGGWTLAAAEAVCGEPGALEYLEQLQACSLVVAAEAGPEMRYRLLETLREFAAEQLTPEEQTDLDGRHAVYFLEAAEAAQPHLAGREQASWLDQLEREHDNLRAALAWSLDRSPLDRAPLPAAGHRDDPSTARGRRLEIGLRLGVALAPFWRVRGYLAEGQERLTELIGAADGAGLEATRAWAQIRAGTLALHHGDYETARRFSQESLATARAVGDRTLLATCLLNLGVVAQRQEADQMARPFLEEALAIQRELGDQEPMAGSLGCLGDLAREQGDMERAIAFYEEARTITQELGDLSGVAWLLTRAGDITWTQGDLSAAQARYEEALALFRELGDRLGVAAALNSLGDLALYQGDADRAQHLAAESLQIRRELGNRRDIAWSLDILGKVMLSRGQPEAARALFAEMLAIGQTLGDAAYTARGLCCLGAVALHQGDLETARSLFTRCLAQRPDLRQRRGLAESLEGLAEIARAEGEPGRAARLFGAAQAVRDALFTPRTPHERVAYERTVEVLRMSLGEPVWRAAWTEGRRMPLAEAVDYALGRARPPDLS